MTIVPNIRRLDGKKRHNTTVTGKTFMATLLLPLPKGFSTLHDIDVFRCSVAEISDNLAGDKRLIVLIISVLQQIIAARNKKKNIPPGRNRDSVYLSQPTEC